MSPKSFLFNFFSFFPVVVMSIKALNDNAKIICKDLIPRSYQEKIIHLL